MDIGTATNEPGAKNGGKPKIIPFLWFDHQAEEAARFYASAFDNSKIGTVVRYGDGGPGPKGSVMTVSFELAGQRFAALNAGPHFAFTEAISFLVNCGDQAEVDALWDKLSEGGEKRRCGWLKDKFGVSWQIVPSVLQDLLHSPDPGKSSRVMQAMLKMTKLDIAALGRAYSDPATDPGLCG
jgi:predicted 3-demethylubiquinone-9 3-methyltransferase (glyoxalase superfamily)